MGNVREEKSRMEQQEHRGWLPRVETGIAVSTRRAHIAVLSTVRSVGLLHAEYGLGSKMLRYQAASVLSVCWVTCLGCAAA